MSTKKKMIVSITSMCVVLLVAVVSVIAVWAATSASVKSNINITYTIEHLDGTMKMRVAERNNTTDSKVTWTSLKTENGSGSEVLSFSGDGELTGSFGGGDFYLWEYTGIQPIFIVEVQMTNNSSTSYFANFITDAISLNGLAEAYVVRDFFADGTDVTPAVSEYYEVYTSNSQDREIVGTSGLTTTDYEIKNDGVYCYYLCLVFDYIKQNFYKHQLAFSVSLHNAYAPEV